MILRGREGEKRINIKFVDDKVTSSVKIVTCYIPTIFDLLIRLGLKFKFLFYKNF